MAQERQDLWKNSVDRKFVGNFAARIAEVYPAFDQSAYVKAVLKDDLLGRELKDRLNTIARHLSDYLPSDYSQACQVLIKAAPLVGEFANWALTAYVELYGQDHFKKSVETLGQLTRHGTSEFGIRPFVVNNPSDMIAWFEKWARNKNEHVRRLAAEGSRPRGVWVAHITDFKKDPRPVLTILELLKSDPSLYVRKAVANNLNDMSKDNPELVVQTARRWLKDHHEHTNWIVRHGCRSLIKKGHPEILKLLGYHTDAKIRLEKFKLSHRQLTVGQQMKFSFYLASLSPTDQRLMIDYRVTYARANGRQSSKVFKLAKKDIRAGEKLVINGQHRFADLSTRKHYPGEHAIELMINGCRLGTATFLLIR